MTAVADRSRVWSKAASSSCRAASLLALQHALLGDGRQVPVLQGDLVEPPLPVLQARRRSSAARRPGRASPISSRRSRCRATKLTTGSGRSGVWASTSFASFCPSWWTNSRSAAWLASQRISSSRNRIRAS